MKSMTLTFQTFQAPVHLSSTSLGCWAQKFHIQILPSSSLLSWYLWCAWWIQSHELEYKCKDVFRLCNPQDNLDTGREKIFKTLFTFNIKVCGCSCRASNKFILSSITKMNIPDCEGVRKLFWTGLALVCWPNLNTILEPLVGDVLIIYIYFKGDGVSLLGIEVF